MCPQTLSDRHDQTETDRALWFFSTGPQRTKWNLQTCFRSIGCLVVEKSRFSDRGWWFGKVRSRTFSDRHNQTKADRALWFFSTEAQRTNLNLQTGLRSIGCSVVEKSRFSDRGWWLPPRIIRVLLSQLKTKYFLKLSFKCLKVNPIFVKYFVRDCPKLSKIVPDCPR